MSKTLLLACDMDRTLLPNGPEPVSPGAIEAFRDFVSSHDVTLVYVSGRDIGLIESAINEFGVPVPDIAVGDVGTTMYKKQGDSWILLEEWRSTLAKDWKGLAGKDIKELLKGVKELTPQEAEKQGEYKESFYTDPSVDKHALTRTVKELLFEAGVQANLVFSVDQIKQVGLFDVLPASASKAHALQYLQKMNNLEHDQIIFAGDSGNDVEALVSGYHSILVANALPEVRAEVEARAKEKGIENLVYFARGGFNDMNGNYSAGILEGVGFFLKEGKVAVSQK